MKAAERREALLARLERADQPLSASALAKEFRVSRQIIVGDIALLRAAGKEIAATPRGYLYTHGSPGIVRKIAVCHRKEQTAEELQICVDYGCSVLDVVVDHPVYGQLVGQLQLASRYDVKQFMAQMEREQGHSLSELTDGIHLHTLRCKDEEAYRLTCEALDAAGILLKESV